MIAPIMVLSLALQVAPTQTNSYQVSRWTIDEGLPTNIITSLGGRPGDYLYLATSGGFVRFDGRRFERMDRLHEALGAIKPIALAWQGDVLWVATPRFVARVDSSVSKFPVGCRSILDIEADGLGVWVNCVDSFHHMDADGPRPIETSVGGVTAVAPDGNGGAWVSGSSGIELLSPSGTVQRRLAFSAQTLAIDVESGRLVWTSEGQLTVREVDGEMRSVSFRGESVGQILVLRDGRLAFPAADLSDTRLLIVDPTTEEMHVDEVVFHSKKNWIRDLYEDEEGNIWAGSVQHGLYRIRSPSVSLITKNNYPIFRVARQGDRIAATLGCDSIDFFRDGRRVEVWETDSDGVVHGCVDAMLEDDDGIFWAGGSFGLLGSRGGRRWRVTMEDTMGRGLAVHALESVGDRLWIGTNRGLYVRDSTVRPALGASELSELQILAIEGDGAGGVWVGTTGGLAHHASGGRLTILDQGVPVGEVRALLRLPDAALLAGWYGGGLALIRGGQVLRLTAENGLIDDYVSGLLQVDDEVWVHTNQGVHRLGLEWLAQTDGTALFGEVLDRMDGFPEANGGGTASIVIGPKGHIWFASTEGLVHVDPDEQRFGAGFPRTRFASVRAGGLELAVGDSLRLPAGTRNLVATFTGINFTRANRVRYRYTMQGFESSWHTSADGRLEYRRLTPGTYTLRVQTYLDGITEPGDEVRVVIQQAGFIYEMRWFQILVVALLVGAAGAIGGAIARRERRRRGEVERLNSALGYELERHSEARWRLSRMARELVSAQEEERKVIARELHDEFGAQLSYLKILLRRHEDQEAEGMVSGVLASLRRLVRSMRPQSLDLFGLASAIRELVEVFEKRTAVRVQNGIDALEDTRFEPELEITAYRFVQEALTNAVRHGEPREIAIEAKVTGGWLRMTVEDDGVGFDTSVADRGLGLRSMAERAESLGGVLTVDAAPDAGTRLGLSLPVESVEKLAVWSPALAEVTSGVLTYRILHNGPLVETIVRGGFDPHGLEEAFRKTAEKLNETGTRVVLLNVVGMSTHISREDRKRGGRLVAGILPQGTVIGLVARPEQLDGRVFLNAVKEGGLKIDVFMTREEAVEVLKGQAAS